MVIEIKDKGKTLAVITAVKISEEKGLVEYQIDEQDFAMGRVAAVKKHGILKLLQDLMGWSWFGK
jgi:hypothetical protein